MGDVVFHWSCGKKKRVSWVLRREVCTWVCFATCTQNKNEGNTYSGQVDVIPWKHTSENRKGCKTATQPHACQLRQTAGGAVPLLRPEPACNGNALPSTVYPTLSPTPFQTHSSFNKQELDIMLEKVWRIFVCVYRRQKMLD